MQAAILRLPAVESLTGYKRSHIYRLARAGSFPKPIALGPGAVGWVKAEVIAWIEQRIRESRAGSAATTRKPPMPQRKRGAS